MVGTVQVLMADEISTGLDSATTFQIMAHLKKLIHLDLTIMVRVCVCSSAMHGT